MGVGEAFPIGSEVELLSHAVWREVARHPDLTALLPALRKQLAPRLRVLGIAVYQLLESRLVPEAVASEGELPALDRALRLEASERLREWGGTATEATTQVPGAKTIVPEDGRTAWAVPLGEAQGVVLFALIVVARPPRDRDGSLLSTLREPLAVAVANHQRIHGIEVSRAAAEADRVALLHRLGRESLHESVVGARQGLRHVMERVGLVASSDLSVLLLGETGTGKEVIARAIHEGSRRADGPFLRVNCGAIPADLIDSELFGHEKGSFTGATGARQGWFERADGGTLFLDEVGELPLSAQVRLLRVLQDGSLRRVGGERELHVDVRIIAATHRDLRAMVRDGTFREDLWYRIAVFPIELPPLRARLADLPALAHHFAERAARRLGLPPQLPTPADIRLLQNYPWPGNVRELIAVIERAAILGAGTGLRVDLALGAAPISAAAPTSAQTEPAQSGDNAFLSLDAAMRRHIEAALELTRGRIEGIGGAADLLKINPHTLRARMRKLGVDPTPFRIGLGRKG